MKYTVVWRPKAEARLAELWMAAADRNEVARASDDFDKRMTNDPARHAPAVFGHTHFLVIEPLGFAYIIRPADCIVEVVWVWRYQPPALE